MDLRAEAKCCSGCIHSNVAAADYNSFLCLVNRCVIIIAESIHEIVAGQVLICGENAVRIFTRNTHEHRKTSTGSDENSLITFLLDQVIKRNRSADDNVRNDLDAEAFNILDFLCDDLLFRKTEFRDAVGQNAAGFMKCLIDRYIISHLGKIACACKTCRAGTDDCDLMTVFDLRSLWFDSILFCAVSYKTLELSDGDRFGLQTADALSFTLGLLRANTAADSGK